MLGLLLQVFESCGLKESPATAILSRLTLLSLRDCCLTVLQDALPAKAVQNLQVLDLSGNSLGQLPDARVTPWTTTNLRAFSDGNWASLRVLGIRLPARSKVSSGLQATATALNEVLQKQAAAVQPPRPPPVVVYSRMHEELLWPADVLAVVQ
jgi:Leucine Rich Repeat